MGVQMIFSDTLASIRQLDEILNSYPGRNRGSVLTDQKSLDVMLRLLVQQQITVTEHTYLFDAGIREDPAAMDLYTGLARQTHWKLFAHTEIEGVRINALRQMQGLGEPSYDGFICYQEGQVCIHCGNLDLAQFLMYLANHEQIQRFYLFTYPYWSEDHAASCYRFEIVREAIDAAKAFQRNAWDSIRRASDGLIPPISHLPMEEYPPDR